MPPGPLTIDLKVINVQCSNASCRKPFTGFSFQQVSNVKRLCAGDVIIYNVKMACIHCGNLFQYHEDDKRMQTDADLMRRLLGPLYGDKQEPST